MFFKKNVAFIFVPLAFQSVVLQASEPSSDEQAPTKDRRDQKGVIARVRQNVAWVKDNIRWKCVGRC